MNQKLTLKLDAETIRHAKIYAKKWNKSLSKLVEGFFRSLTEDDAREKAGKHTPLVNELTGIIAFGNDRAHLHEDYTNYLTEKYK